MDADLSNLSPEKQKEMLDQARREMPLYFLEMNACQERFIRVKNRHGWTPKRRLWESSNKNGKCTTYRTLIDTPNGPVPVGVLYGRGEPFDVWAWDGEKRVVARASAPIKKAGLHQCYRITMSDGQWVEAADEHRVLCDDASYRSVAEIASFFLQESRNTLFFSETCSDIPRGSNSAPSLSVLPSGAVRWSEIQSDCRGGYSSDFRQCGERPLIGVDSGQFSSPLQGDVPTHNGPLSQTDGRGRRYIGIPSLFFALPSSLCGLLRRGGRSVEFLSHAAYNYLQSLTYGPQTFQQLSTVGAFGSLLDREFGQSLLFSGSDDSFSSPACCNPPLSECCNKIISLYPIACQEVYDFEVEKHHNYFAGGLIHHNTYFGIAEDIAHAVGFRAWLDPGDVDYKVDIKIPNIGMIGGETIKHSIGEKIEPLLRVLIPPTCKAVFKPGSTGILSRVTIPFDPYGGKCGSQIYCRSYDEKADSFEGIDYDWIHWDEPPPEGHLRAAERGKAVSNARSWFTMTPIKEPYIYSLFSQRAAIVC